ncbi:MAG: cytochrome c3 family protein, partial [Dehalococcoidia bacterium]|nr:cytochrome c3 family protein [Dehalococcoidia bacterium]
MRKYRVPRPSSLVLLGLFLAVFGLWAAGAVFQNAKARTSETPEKRPVQSIMIGDVVTASQCAPCHGETRESFSSPVLRFEHDVHLARGLECSNCHTEFPHTVRQTSVPSMETCFNCHNQDHPSIGVIAPGDCALCHTSGFHDAPSWHGEEFRDG